MSAEYERQLANMTRIGVIEEVDVVHARATVSVGGLITDWLPWGVQRASGMRTWSAPSVGEQVVVHSPYGDTGQAFIGQSIYQDDHDQPANSADQTHIVFPDGSTVDYNSASNTLTVTVSGGGNVIVNCKNATVNADTKVQLTTPLVECSQNMKINGNVEIVGTASVGGATTLHAVTSNGHNISSTHVHTLVQAGVANSGPPP